MKLSEKIKIAIKEAGYTQQTFADKLGITNPVVNVWCTGKRNPTTTTLKKIAKATNKPLSYFFADEKSANIVNNSNGGDNVINSGTDVKEIYERVIKLEYRVEQLEKNKK